MLQSHVDSIPSNSSFSSSTSTRSLTPATTSSVIGASESPSSRSMRAVSVIIGDLPMELRQKHPSHREASHWRTNLAVSTYRRVDLSHVDQWKLNITLVLHPRR